MTNYQKWEKWSGEVQDGEGDEEGEVQGDELERAAGREQRKMREEVSRREFEAKRAAGAVRSAAAVEALKAKGRGRGGRRRRGECASEGVGGGGGMGRGGGDGGGVSEGVRGGESEESSVVSCIPMEHMNVGDGVSNRVSDGLSDRVSVGLSGCDTGNGIDGNRSSELQCPRVSAEATTMSVAAALESFSIALSDIVTKNTILMKLMNVSLEYDWY